MNISGGGRVNNIHQSLQDSSWRPNQKSAPNAAESLVNLLGSKCTIERHSCRAAQCLSCCHIHHSVRKEKLPLIEFAEPYLGLIQIKSCCFCLLEHCLIKLLCNNPSICKCLSCSLLQMCWKTSLPPATFVPQCFSFLFFS